MTITQHFRGRRRMDTVTAPRRSMAAPIFLKSVFFFFFAGLQHLQLFLFIFIYNHLTYCMKLS